MKGSPSRVAGLVGSIAASMALAAPLKENTLPHPAKLEPFVRGTSGVQSLLRERIRGIWVDSDISHCNFSRVLIEDIPYNVTARHCFVFDGRTPDALISTSFTDLARSVGDYRSEFVAIPNLPEAVKISRYTSESIGTRPLRITGCFPDIEKKRMICYHITGISNPSGMLTHGRDIFITNADQERILSHDSGTRKRTRISGMSGSPVFDEHGDLFGVVSMNTNRGDHVQQIRGYSIIAIQSLRGPEGNLLIRPRNPKR